MDRFQRTNQNFVSSGKLVCLSLLLLLLFLSFKTIALKKLAGLLHPISAMTKHIRPRSHTFFSSVTGLFDWNSLDYLWFAFRVITLVLFLQPSIDNSLSKRTKENLVEG